MDEINVGKRLFFCRKTLTRKTGRLEKGRLGDVYSSPILPF
jgi:hypothetical protein